MKKSERTDRIQNASRISFMAVAAGVLLTLAGLFFFTSLSAALGFWSYRREDLPLMGPQFWTAASLSWGISVFLGSFATALAARSKTIKNGLLNALTAWAASYLLFGGVAMAIVDSHAQTILGAPPVWLFWHGFVGDAMALACAVVGGTFGTWFERGTFRVRVEVEESVPAPRFDKLNAVKP